MHCVCLCTLGIDRYIACVRTCNNTKQKQPILCVHTYTLTSLSLCIAGSVVSRSLMLPPAPVRWLMYLRQPGGPHVSCRCRVPAHEVSTLNFPSSSRSLPAVTPPEHDINATNGKTERERERERERQTERQRDRCRYGCRARAPSHASTCADRDIQVAPYLHKCRRSSSR